MDKIVFRSEIPKELLKKRLFSGSILAIIGGLLILFAGAFVPVQLLSIWGFPALIVGLGLIAVGLIPYKILKKRQMDPYTITVTPHDLHIDLKKGPITIPHSAVAQIFYQDGILFKLHPIGEEPSVHKAEIFCPYFTKKQKEELEKILFTI